MAAHLRTADETPEDRMLRDLDALGAEVIGPVVDGIGFDGGHLVRHPVASSTVRKAQALGWRACASGQETVIYPPRSDG